MSKLFPLVQNSNTFFLSCCFCFLKMTTFWLLRKLYCLIWAHHLPLLYIFFFHPSSPFHLHLKNTLFHYYDPPLCTLNSVSSHCFQVPAPSFTPSCSHMFSVSLPVDSSLAVLRYVWVYRPADPHPTRSLYSFQQPSCLTPATATLEEGASPATVASLPPASSFASCHPDVSLKFYYNCLSLWMFYCFTVNVVILETCMYPRMYGLSTPVSTTLWNRMLPCPRRPLLVHPGHRPFFRHRGITVILNSVLMVTLLFFLIFFICIFTVLN